MNKNDIVEAMDHGCKDAKASVHGTNLAYADKCLFNAPYHTTEWWYWMGYTSTLSMATSTLRQAIA